MLLASPVVASNGGDLLFLLLHGLHYVCLRWNFPFLSRPPALGVRVYLPSCEWPELTMTKAVLPSRTCSLMPIPLSPIVHPLVTKTLHTAAQVNSQMTIEDSGCSFWLSLVTMAIILRGPVAKTRDHQVPYVRNGQKLVRKLFRIRKIKSQRR